MARRDAEFHGSVRHLLKTPVPTREEERALLARMAAGDARARDQLALGMGRLIAKIAARYKDHDIPHEDLFMIGMQGCLEALDKWNHAATCRVATYAGHWIEMRIRRTLSWEARTIRIPERALGIERRMNKGGKVSPKWRHALTHAARVAASLDEPVLSGEPMTLGDTLGDHSAGALDAQIDAEALLSQEWLSDEDRAIVWGVHVDALGFRDLARELRMRVSQVARKYRQALLRLRVSAQIPGASAEAVQMWLPGLNIGIRPVAEATPRKTPGARAPSEAGRRPRQRTLPLRKRA